MKKSNPVVGQKSLLSFFTKAPTSTIAKAPESESIQKELVKPLVVKEINTPVNDLPILAKTNDGMDVDDVVVKKRGRQFITCIIIHTLILYHFNIRSCLK